MTPCRRRFIAPLAVLVATFCTALPAAAQSPSAAPRAANAWARPTVAGQAAGGGYVTLTGGSAPDRLVGAAAPVARSVELHTMTMEGDVMRMREVAGVDLPAGGTVELKPGGLHLMFVGLAKPLAAGTRFPLTLRFEKAGAVEVEVQVAATQPAPKAGHAGHSGH